jgi:hypothetical protein
VGLKNPITGIGFCCAPADSAAVIPAPADKINKSRRFIR